MRAKRKFTVVIEQDEDGFYLAWVPTLHGCHTQAKNLDTLTRRIREAIQLCLEVQGENNVDALELVGVQQVAV